MTNKIFGNIEFNMGWETKNSITLFNKEYEIVVSAISYREEDLITTEQENSFNEFLNNKSEIEKKMEEIISSWVRNEEEKEALYPVLLRIERNGNYAAAFDGVDEGIVITIKPEYAVTSPDLYF